MIDFAVQLFNSSNLTRRLPFSEGILQFWTTNQEQPESTFALRNREIEKHRYFQGSSTKFKEIQQENNTFTARDRYCMAPHLFSHQNNFFSVSNACLIVIIHHFSYHPDRKLRLTWDFFWISAKDFFSVYQSAIKISWHPHHPIYPLRLLMCQSERAPAFRENEVWCRVWDRTERNAVVIVREIDGFRRRPKAD